MSSETTGHSCCVPAAAGNRILTAEQAQSEPLPATGSVVGIDMGTVNFLADSGGEFVSNPRHGAKGAAKLEAAQQAPGRCKRGSKRRRKGVETIARLHRKVRRQTPRSGPHDRA